jgi:putative hydrolase of the HAD superfamily
LRIFFDVDGVLIDGWHSRPERRRYWDLDMERDLGIARSALQKAVFAPSRDGGPPLIARCSLGELDLKETLADVLPGLGFHRPVEQFLDYWFTRDSVINQSVFSVVRQLAGRGDVALYVATNQERYRADWLWNGLGLRQHFRGIFYSGQIGVLKTEAAFFHAVDAELGRSKTPSLLVDDSPPVCDAAGLAGWETCLFDSIDDLVTHSRVGPLLAP